MYVIKDSKFDLPLIFVDSNEASEMSTSDNIKSIEIIDANAQNLNITGWHIDNNIKTSDFIFRSIQTEAILDYEGVFIPKEIIITYKDNVSKRYDFGDFKIISYSNDYYSDNLIAGVVCNIISIPSNNRDVYPYSGLVVFIKGYTEEISIEKIDLGINSFGIDSDNVVFYQSDYDFNLVLNYIEDGLKRNEEWAKELSDIKLVDKVDSNIRPIILEKPQNNNYGTNIILPLTALKNININEVKVFNIKITINNSGDVKELIKFQPYYITPFTIDYFDKKGRIKEYLEEEGI